MATRPDCFNDGIFEYLSDLNKRTDLTIELGLQQLMMKLLEVLTVDMSLKPFKTFNKLKELNIKTLVHLINGLPNESMEMMLDNARVIGKLKPWGMKFHSLYITKNTTYAKLYEKEPFKIMELDEYIDLIVNQLEIIPQNIVIERLTGDPVKDRFNSPILNFKEN